MSGGYITKSAAMTTVPTDPTFIIGGISSRIALRDGDRMSETNHSNSTAYTVFDYLGLGIILVPPGVVVEALMNNKSLTWAHAAYGIPALVVGAACIYVGRHWDTIRLKLWVNLAQSIDRINNGYLAPAIVFVSIISLLVISPLLLWRPASTMSAATMPTADEIASALVNKLPPPKDDGAQILTLQAQLAEAKKVDHTNTSSGNAAPNYPVRAPSDADREILVLDRLHDYIANILIPNENAAAQLTDDWRRADSSTRKSYIDALNAQADKLDEVYKELKNQLKGHDVYCNLDLCSIIQPLTIRESVTADHLRTVGRALLALASVVNWDALIYQSNHSPFPFDSAPISAIIKGVFTPDQDVMTPGPLIQDAVARLSQRRDELTKEAAPK